MKKKVRACVRVEFCAACVKVCLCGAIATYAMPRQMHFPGHLLVVSSLVNFRAVLRSSPALLLVPGGKRQQVKRICDDDRVMTWQGGN